MSDQTTAPVPGAGSRALIAAVLRKSPAEILHEKSGVRVQVRLCDGDTGTGPVPEGVDESAETWSYSVDQGDAKDAADAALDLLCTIADVPADAPVSICDT